MTYPRYFTHATKFSDSTAYIVFENPNAAGQIITTDGTPSMPPVALEHCEQFARAGKWKEITEAEAKALAATEVEL